MSLKLSSLGFLDARRRRANDRLRHIRVDPDATLQDLLSLRQDAPARSEVVHLLFMSASGGSADETLDARGAAHRLDLRDMNVPLPRIFEAARAAARAACGEEKRERGGGEGRNDPADAYASKSVGVEFKRTLRVGKSACGEIAPVVPGATNFTVVPPRRGAVPYVGMMQCEAMAVQLSSRTRCAVKIGFDGVNAVSGEPWVAGLLSQQPQNYMVLPPDEVLIGVCGRGDRADQFVAPPIAFTPRGASRAVAGEGKTPAGRRLTVEVFPLNDFSVWVPSKKQFLDPASVDGTPRMLGLEPGDGLVFLSEELKEMAPFLTLQELGVTGKEDIVLRCRRRVDICVKALGEPPMTISVDEDVDCIADLEDKVAIRSGVPKERQQLVFRGVPLHGEKNVKKCGLYNMSEVHLIVRGKRKVRDAPTTVAVKDGLVEQKFAKDDSDVKRFSVSRYSSSSVDIVNSVGFACRSRQALNASPLTKEVYERDSRGAASWEPLFDDDATVAEGVANGLRGKLAMESRNTLPDGPLCDVCSRDEMEHVLNPCDHKLCPGCFSQVEEVPAETPVGGQRLLICPLCESHVFLRKKVRFGASQESESDSADGSEEEAEEEREDMPILSRVTIDNADDSSSDVSSPAKPRRSTGLHIWRRSQAKRSKKKLLAEYLSPKSSSDGEETHQEDENSVWFGI